MVRTACATLVALLFAVAPADAAFQSCTYDAGTHEATATFGTGLTGNLRQVGTQIQADGVACGAATTANTDTIRVVGSNGVHEQLTVDLSGGTFLGGFTDEPGTSDEVEIVVELKTDNFEISDDAFIAGTAGADHITVGMLGFFDHTAVNLNGNETDGIDADVTFDGERLVEVRGLAGNDVLSANGDAGMTSGDIAAELFGDEGDDDLTNGFIRPGDGSDTIRAPAGGATTIRYIDAPGPTTVTLQNGTGGIWGGTAPSLDGYGDTDTYIGRPSSIIGTPFGDTFTGTTLNTTYEGRDGNDTITGGTGIERLRGGNGIDTIHGGGGDDEVLGEANGDFVFGDDGNDIVDGGTGSDQESGGDGDDQLRQSGFGQLSAEAPFPNGADDLSGGPGTDSLEYGDPSTSSASASRSAAVAVDLDDIADDGASGEGDNARADIENVVGGRGNDTLVGNGAANVLSGFAGADTLRGGGGADTLRGLGARGPSASTVEDDIVDGADDFDGEAGTDTIDANEGDDKVEAREGTADSITCGPGNDTGRGDRVDTIAADCEGIALPVELPVTPVVQTQTQTQTQSPPPAQPPAAPPAPPRGPGVTPPAQRPAPAYTTLLTLPSSRRCVSRRKFTVRVKRQIRGSVRRVQIFVNGKASKTVTGARVGLPIDLRGLPKGTVTVRLRVELADGRVATGTRRYRTCAKRS